MFALSVYRQFRMMMLLPLALAFVASSVYAQSPAPPLGGTALKKWLEAGHYKTWRAESGIHDSAGPHFGKVRAYLNPVLFDSMTTGGAQHPEGSVAVKELYGGGDTVLGWAVAIKTAPDSDGGANWYWYEYYDDRTVRDGEGVPLCSGCHTAGQDYVRTPWPVQ